MNNLKRAACVVVVLVCGSSLAAQHRIDLRQQKPQKPSDNEPIRSAGDGIAGRSPGQLPLRLPLQIELTALNRRDVFIGERIGFDVTITNTGAATIALPWTPRRVVGGNHDADQSEMRVAVALREGGYDVVLTSARLFGWTKRPESFLSLGPRETATIQADGVFQPRTADVIESALLQSLPRVVNLQATLSVNAPTGEWIAPIWSSNAVPTFVNVRGKP